MSYYHSDWNQGRLATPGALSIPSQFTLLHTSLNSLTLGNLREESVLNALQSGYLRGDGKMCGSAFVIGKWYFQNRLG